MYNALFQKVEETATDILTERINGLSEKDDPVTVSDYINEHQEEIYDEIVDYLSEVYYSTAEKMINTYWIDYRDALAELCADGMLSSYNLYDLLTDPSITWNAVVDYYTRQADLTDIAEYI
jgi:hypothetical protein